MSVVAPARHDLAVDVLVRADPGTTLEQVRADLLRAIGEECDGQAPLFIDGEQVQPGAELGIRPLLEGALLCVGRPGGTPGRAAGTSGAFLELHCVGGPDAGLVHRLAPGPHRIGRAGTGVLTIEDPDISRAHAQVSVVPAGLTICDLGSTNGTFADGERVGAEQVGVSQSSRILVGSSALRIRVPTARPAAAWVRDGLVHVNRSPRIVAPVPPVTLQMPAAPLAQKRPRVPYIAMVVPLLLAVPLAVLLGSWYFLMFGLLSPLMLAGNLVSDRLTGRKDHVETVTAYETECTRVSAVLRDALLMESLRRHDAAPDAAELLCTATGGLRRIWERHPAHEDYLMLRVGTAAVASRVALRQASAPQSGPEVTHPLIDDAPVTVALADLGVVGVAGHRSRGLALVRSMLAQVATLHSPRQVSVVALLTDPGDCWGWVAWLPHNRPCDELPSGYSLLGVDPEQVRRRVAELTALLESRLHAAGSYRTGSGFDGRHVVLLLDGAQSLRAVPGVSRLLDLGPSVGIYSICLDEDPTQLPVECRGTVVVEGEVATRLRVARAGEQTAEDVVADLVSDRWAHRLARGLAPLRDATPQAGTGLPGSVRLLDQLGFAGDDPVAVARHWQQQPRSTWTVLGAAAEGSLGVDLRADGPHLLVAGTTGAGKSELLQTLIAGLALVNRPDELVFVLVDYKGGSAFAECSRLPHTVGLVTDLDGTLTARALESLGAEIARREGILARAGAQDLDSYILLRQAGPSTALEPLPRLVLVIDEFRVLAEELPDFISGLVRLAAVGRSLGVHLVLATQRPQGVVSADIKANVNLRIALRVQEPADSLDVVDTSEAAVISDRTPGRAVLRAGSAPTVAFQAARVAVAGRDSGRVRTSVRRLDWATLGDPRTGAARCEDEDGPTDLCRIVAAVAAAAAAEGICAGPSPWLAPLPLLLELDPVPGAFDGAAGHGARLTYGVVDEPARQRQVPAVWDLATDGPLAVVGTTRSGRTSLLRTLLVSLARTCEGEGWAYVLDGGGALTGVDALSGVGAVVGREDTERALRVLDLLVSEIDARQRRFAEEAVSGLLEQREQAGRHGRQRLPWVVLAVDGWESLQQAWEVSGGLRGSDALLQVLRQGPAVGVLTVIAGGRSVLSGQVGSTLAQRLVLRTADPGDAVMSGIPSRAVPSTWPPGRALLVGGHEEGAAVRHAQVALLDRDPAGTAQQAALTRAARQVLGAAGGQDRTQVPPVPAMPHSVPLHEVPVRPEDRSASWLALGVGGSRVSAQGWDPERQGPTLLVGGHPGSGRSSTLLTLAHSALAIGRTLVVVLPRRSPLEDLEGLPGVTVLAPHQGETLDQALAAARGAGTPALVLVDDVEVVDGSTIEPLLIRLVSTVTGSGQGLAAAGSTPEMLGRFNGLSVHLRRPGLGLVLGPAATTDGDLLGVRLGRQEQRLPGRGVMVDRGRCVAIQVASSTRELRLNQMPTLNGSCDEQATR